MRTHIAVWILLTALPLAAQEFEHPYRWQAYGYYGAGYAPGSTDNTIQQLGGGGEGFLYKGLSAGADIGFQYPTYGFTYGIGMFSANGGYHFNHKREAKLVPFVTAGYSLAFREENVNLANFGGGLTWWIIPRLGIRAEVRDYLWPLWKVRHSPQFRLAVTFR